MVWQIERAREERSTCRDCDRFIPRGTYRFGNYELDRWYHLECAAVRNSRSFQPFAKEAAALLQPDAPPPRAPRLRNAELEARLVAQPDEATMAVFADWLQSVGDPWGELIAFELAHKEPEARRVLKEHFDDLIGAFAPRTFEWRRGFIHRATLETLIPATNASRALVDLFALRTTVLLRELHVPMLLRPDAVTVLNKQAPRALRRLYLWFTNNLQLLDLPELEHVTFHVSPYASIDVEAIAPFLAATRLPKLARLRIEGDTLRLPTLTALLDSQLVKQLTWLEITDGALDTPGAQLVARRAADLAHIPVLNFPVALDDVFPAQKAAWRARAGEEP